MGNAECDKRATLSSLNDYYEKLMRFVSEGEDDIRFQNEDRAHNAIVMQLILENATVIKMYCGEFSIFRKGFKKKVEDSIDYESDEDKELPMQNLYNSLEQFLRKDGTSLDVIIENTGHIFWEDFYSLQNLYSFITSGKIKFYVFKDGFSNFSDAYHFTVGDTRMYRRESDKEKHNAIGGFNNPTGAKILLTRFEQLMENVIPLIKKHPLPQLVDNKIA